ncbi:MAG: hypothetical protein IVW55_04025 [Chloroflexi bacterium]|nr:hypothetical protein [Chloroflexota bacterium]
MWHDNESELDLLGFDTLVDTVVMLVHQPNLLPLTLGIFSDWGGGKSSLMAQARNRLASEQKNNKARYICLTFNPWQHEDYDDVKAALMIAVMTALLKNQSFIDKVQEAAGSKVKELAQKLWRRINWFRVAGFAAKGVGALYALSQAQPTGITLTLGNVNDVIDTAKAVAEVGKEVLKDEKGGDASEKKEPIEQSIGEFRRDFQDLLASLDVDALVVFVDDLDRCLPSIVVDTLEAIRLFLAVPKTVFVLGADEEVVRDAIATRYPELARQREDVGRKYLEKMVQIPIRIPPLTAPETETYLNLLGCLKYLEPGTAETLVQAAKQNRTTGTLDVAMDEGIAKTHVGDLPEDLTTYLHIVARIAPTLSGGLQGNPRQTKRFMNTLLMRQELAKLRGVDLDPAVLAKLMILEYFYEVQYQQLFRWQQEGKGYAQPLEEMEAQPLGTTPDEGASLEEDVRVWLGRADLRSWLALEPKLAKIDLGPYFYFSRDKALAKIETGRRLSQPLQEILGRLLSDSDIDRSAGETAAVALSTEEFSQVYEVVLSRFVRDPRTQNSRLGPTLIKLGAAKRDAIPALAKALQDAPVKLVQSAIALQISTSCEQGGLPAEMREVLQRWTTQNDNPALKRSTEQALAGPRPMPGNRR